MIYLSDECAKSTSEPIARNTYDGSNEAEVHAEPDESEMPGRRIRSDSPSTPAKDMLRMPG